MKIVLINARWSPLYYKANELLNDLSQTYNVEVVSYDYDMDREKILYFNISNMIPLLIILKDNQELTRLYITEDTEKIKTKLAEIFRKYPV